MIDRGADWGSRFDRSDPSALVLWREHLDHAIGLVRGTPCLVMEWLGLDSRQESAMQGAHPMPRQLIRSTIATIRIVIGKGTWWVSIDAAQVFCN